MMETEEKARVVAMLFATLKTTDFCHDDLMKMYYSTTGPYPETVIMEWSSGRVQEIDVSYDSGIAIIRDVVQSIEL